MKLEIDIPDYVFEQVKRENTIKNVLNKIDFAVRNGVERPHEKNGGVTKKCPNCRSDLYEYCFMCCYEGKKVRK